jgi:polyisoprenoid-binding protein YceI
MKDTCFAAVLGGALIAASTAQAADDFAIDANHTNIYFVVDHLGYSKMLGQFQEFDGSFTFDKDDVAASKVSVTIKTASVDTDHRKRDDHLRSPDFFNAVEFPEITFVSTKAEKTGAKSGRITGDFTMMGVTRPVVLEVTFNKLAPHPLPFYKGVLVAGFSASTTIRRSDFGMKYGTPNLGDEITVRLEVEAHKK